MNSTNKKWLAIMLLVLLLISIVNLDIVHSDRKSMLDKYVSEEAQANDPSNSLNNSKLVAHACGAYDGMAYTNSLNALNANYNNGFRLFEIDFNMTSDGHIALIHDWGGTEKKLLGTQGIIYSDKSFLRKKAVNNLTLMDSDTLISWLGAHNNAYVVTDCKGNNLAILKKISVKYPNMLNRFFPQMGPFSEYPKLRQMGYRNIILALYKTNYNDSDIIKFAETHKLFAVSMWASRAETGLPEKLKLLNIKVYAHTVNSLDKYKQLLNNGVYGIYTDSIAPAERKGLIA